MTRRNERPPLPGEGAVPAPCTRLLPLLLLLPFILAALSCTRQRPPADAERPARVRFEVDESRLGPLHRSPELGLLFRPPAGWAEVPREPIEQAPTPPPLAGRPTAAFLSPENGSLCLLSRLDFEPPEDGTKYDLELGHYVTELEQYFRGLQVDVGRFTVDVYRVVQLRVVGPDRVLFQLILTSPALPAVRIDYAIPQPAFEEEILKLESSIGSIRRLRE